MAKSSITPKQQRFVEEYLVDMNGTQAAIRAGYAPRSARVAASRLLMKDNIASALADMRARIADRLEVTAERVISELAALGFANMADYYHQREDGTVAVDTDALLDRNRAAAITQMDIQTTKDGTQSIKVRLADKKVSLVELGKHLGLFTDRAEVAVTNHRERVTDPRHLAMAVITIMREAREAQRTNGPLIEET